MADIGTAIRQYLVSNATVSGLVSTRIYPDDLPQNCTLPAITYYRVSTEHYGDITGTKTGLAVARLQIDCFATTRAGANALAEAVRKSGVLDLGHTTTNGVDIGSVVLDDGQRHFVEPPTDGNHEKRYVTSQDFAITFAEDF